MSVPTISDLVAGGRIAAGLIRLVYRPCTPERARTLIVGRMARRNELFLEMVWKTIWRQPTSPYRRLLTWAGWTFDTLRDSVHQRGLDDTLKALRDAGVYLTYQEFKGRRPIQRDGLTIECTERAFDNPAVSPAFMESTGGTRSQGSMVPASLDFLMANRAPARILLLDSLGVSTWPAVLWLSFDPGAMWWLSLAHMGSPALRWFSISPLSAFGVPRRRQMHIYQLARAIGATRGLRLPPIEDKPLSAVEEVLDAILAARAARGRCVVVSSPSVATRLAGAAGQRRVDLADVMFVVQSEPLTPGKHANITRTGARVVGRYGFAEAGSVAEGCTRPTNVDDAHVLTDCFGLVSEKRPLPDGSTANALILTSLLPTAPQVLLNVESDDFADVSVLRCGCPLDGLGLSTHVSNIRSFSKLTGEGATVLGTDCVRILEEVLPREFGGQSIDYQLLEAEDRDHLTRLYLVVSPSVGQIDEKRVLRRFIEELRDPRRARSMMPTLWRQADTIQVIRREPVPTSSGKLLPFHTQALAARSEGTGGDELPAERNALRK